MSYKKLPEEGINNSTIGRSDDEIILDSPNGTVNAHSPHNILPESRVMEPMSAWAGSATIINLVLATGPFSYPFAFVQTGLVGSLVLMLVVMAIAYMTATFMMEAIAVSCAKRYQGRSDTLFPLIQGEDPKLKLTRDHVDSTVKDSPFYIRQKLEIGLMADDLLPKVLKYILLFVLVLYMYGAMCLKYVAGAKSLVEGVSVTIFQDQEKLEEKMGFDPYFIALFIFAAITIYFSFGNIENAKTLQIVTTVMRFVAILLMIIGSIISFFHSNGGIAPPKKLFHMDFNHFHVLFGNTIFIFI